MSRIINVKERKVICKKSLAKLRASWSFLNIFKDDEKLLIERPNSLVLLVLRFPKFFFQRLSFQ